MESAPFGAGSVPVRDRLVDPDGTPIRGVDLLVDSGLDPGWIRGRFEVDCVWFSWNAAEVGQDMGKHFRGHKITYGSQAIAFTKQGAAALHKLMVESGSSPTHFDLWLKWVLTSQQFESASFVVPPIGGTTRIPASTLTAAAGPRPSASRGPSSGVHPASIRGASQGRSGVDPGSIWPWSRVDSKLIRGRGIVRSWAVPR